MKFSEIEAESWESLKPYLDTCLLPVTGLTGHEAPHEAAEALGRLRDLLELVEIPFKGRVVTYPAYHFVSTVAAGDDSALRHVCQQLRSVGFRHVIVASLQRELALHLPEADLVLVPEADGTTPDAIAVSIRVETLWRMASAAKQASTDA